MLERLLAHRNDVLPDTFRTQGLRTRSLALKERRMPEQLWSASIPPAGVPGYVEPLLSAWPVLWCRSMEYRNCVHELNEWRFVILLRLSFAQEQHEHARRRTRPSADDAG